MSLWSLILEGMKMRGRRISFLPLFVVGLFIGIVIVYFGKSTIVNNGGLLDEETYVWIRDCRIDKGAFFAYLLFRRFRLVFILILLSTTYLGMIVCVIFPFVFGVSYGLLLGTAVFRYGFQGVLLCLTGCFPQLLLYLPALAFLLRHCGNLCRKIYYQKEIRVEKGFLFHTEMTAFLIRILLVCLMIIIGCVLEGYVSVSLLQNLLILYS